LQVKGMGTSRGTREVTDSIEKGKVFFEQFFPLPNPETPAVLEGHVYPQQKWEFQNITDEQTHCAIQKMKPYKATKKGSIPNCVFVKVREALVPFIALLFQATHLLKYYPQEWAITEMLVLKKPGKTDYTLLGAWRPIVLSDGLARLLNSCHTEDMVSMCEALYILPNNHFRAQPG